MEPATATIDQAPPAPIDKPNGKPAKDPGVGIAVATVNPKELESLKRDSRRIHEAEDLEATAQESEKEYLSSKEETRSFKKKWEADVDRLRKRIREKNDLLPFGDKSKDKSGAAAAGDTDDIATRDKAAFDAAGLSDIGIIGKQAEKLEADGVHNGADLQKWIGGHPPRKISGIGDNAIEKITELMAKFYENRRAERLKRQKSDAKKTEVAATEDPSGATSGTAVTNKKSAIKADIESVLKSAKIKVSKENNLAVIAAVAGVAIKEAKVLVKSPLTLATLTGWHDKITAMKPADVKQLFAKKK